MTEPISPMLLSRPEPGVLHLDRDHAKTGIVTTREVEVRAMQARIAELEAQLAAQDSAAAPPRNVAPSVLGGAEAGLLADPPPGYDVEQRGVDWYWGVSLCSTPPYLSSNRGSAVGNCWAHRDVVLGGGVGATEPPWAQGHDALRRLDAALCKAVYGSAGTIGHATLADAVEHVEACLAAGSEREAQIARMGTRFEALAQEKIELGERADLADEVFRVLVVELRRALVAFDASHGHASDDLVAAVRAAVEVS